MTNNLLKLCETLVKTKAAIKYNKWSDYFIAAKMWGLERQNVQTHKIKSEKWAFYM